MTDHPLAVIEDRIRDFIGVMLEPIRGMLIRQSGGRYDYTKSNCILLNGIFANALACKGINHRLVGGNHAVAFNEDPGGLLNYGFNMPTQQSLHVLADTADPLNSSDGFFGHAWIEIPEIDAIVDLTLLDLPNTASESARLANLPDVPVVIDIDPIVHKRDLKQFSDIMVQGTGLAYQEVTAKTQHVNNIANLLFTTAKS